MTSFEIEDTFELRDHHNHQNIIQNGVYSKRDIGKHQILGEYKGYTILKFVLNNKQEYIGTISPYMLSKYTIDIDDVYMKDAQFEDDCIFREINDYRMLSNEPNCVLHSNPQTKKIYIMSIKDITEGEELLIDYTIEYWLYHLTNMYKNSCNNSNHIINTDNRVRYYWNNFNNLINQEIKNNNYKYNPDFYILDGYLLT